LLIIPLDNKDNYINIPEKILDSITKKRYSLPYYFKITSNIGLKTYVGVKEFTAEKQTIQVPQHIINYLGTERANICLVKDIPKGSFVKFKVSDESFYNIPDYDLFLTNELSKYCILDKNIDIPIDIMNKRYTLTIKELKIKVQDKLIDSDCIDIVNIDLNVDFHKDISKRIFPKDINIKKPKNESSYFDKFTNPGRKLSDNSIKLTREQIRQKRLEKLFGTK